MPDVVKHAWTHRPKALGGTDPLPGLPFMSVYGTNSQVVSSGSGTYAEYEFWSGNNTDVFESPIGTDDQILVKALGLYVAYAIVEVISGDIAKNRSMYTQIQPDATYPTTGTEWGWPTPWSFDSSLLDQSSVRQVHIGLGVLSDPTTLPWRAVIVMNTIGGVSYTTNVRALTIIRLNDGATTGWTIGGVPT